MLKNMKEAFEPDFRDMFYYYISESVDEDDPTKDTWIVCWDEWLETPEQLAMKKCGLIFKTIKEAQNALPQKYLEMTGRKYPYKPKERNFK